MKDALSPLERARWSLEGLSIGDAFGEQFFFRPATAVRELPPPPWQWTDDTAMAVSVVEVLGTLGRIDQDRLARAFARRYKSDPGRGYGPGAHTVLDAVARGVPWRKATRLGFSEGSYGNGAAMRVAPLGAFFADDLDRVVREAGASAEVTHAHPEGQAGAIAVAIAAALAPRPAPPDGNRFLEEVVEHVPPGAVQDGIARAMAIPRERWETAVRILGTGYDVSAQDTVPFCLWMVAHHGADFEEALRLTARGGGDMDTTCAIVGGIVSLRVSTLPAEWRARREPLP